MCTIWVFLSFFCYKRGKNGLKAVLQVLKCEIAVIPGMTGMQC